MKLLYVQGGDFRMGSDPNADLALDSKVEQPMHAVWLDTTEDVLFRHLQLMLMVSAVQLQIPENFLVFARRLNDNIPIAHNKGVVYGHS